MYVYVYVGMYIGVPIFITSGRPERLNRALYASVIQEFTFWELVEIYPACVGFTICAHRPDFDKTNGALRRPFTHLRPAGFKCVNCLIKQIFHVESRELT